MGRSFGPPAPADLIAACVASDPHTLVSRAMEGRPLAEPISVASAYARLFFPGVFRGVSFPAWGALAPPSLGEDAAVLAFPLLFVRGCSHGVTLVSLPRLIAKQPHDRGESCGPGPVKTCAGTHAPVSVSFSFQTRWPRETR